MEEKILNLEQRLKHVEEMLVILIKRYDNLEEDLGWTTV